MTKLIFGKEARGVCNDIRNDASSVKKEFPESFHNQRFRNILPEDAYTTLAEELHLKASTTFGDLSIDISILPKEEGNTTFIVENSQIPVHIQNLRKGLVHCLRLENEVGKKIDIIEHIISVLSAFRIKADIIIKMDKEMIKMMKLWEKIMLFLKRKIFPMNWPSFDDCNGKIIDHIAKTGLIDIKGAPIEKVTTNTELGMQFPNGAFVGFLPVKEGQKEKKRIYNRINYPHIPHVGDQNMEIEMTPELYAYLGRARPPAMADIREKLLTLFRDRKIFLTSLHYDNVFVVSKDKIQNPSEHFLNTYWEIMAHEFIDKWALWGILNESLNMDVLGTLICYKSSHAQELAFFKAFYEKIEELVIPCQGISQRSLRDPA